MEPDLYFYLVIFPSLMYIVPNAFFGVVYISFIYYNYVIKKYLLCLDHIKRDNYMEIYEDLPVDCWYDKHWVTDTDLENSELDTYEYFGPT